MIELVVGGARSGKSRYALNSALARPGPHVFIATAEAGDQSMADRIASHQQERGQEWALVEESRFLSRVIADFSDGDIVVVDCLTLWLSNWLCGEQPDGWNEEKSAFLQSLERTEAHIILVSNETGMGVVPMGELSRKFVDESGWMHQEIAAHADRVIMMMLGIPQLLKP